MAKAGAASRVVHSADGASAGTRDRLVEAAVAALVIDGFVCASARSIAQRAGLNQGLVFYHFGSVANLLLAALDKVSADRMLAYDQALADASGLTELTDVASRIYQHDLDSGYVKVLVEMIAGAGASDDLRAEVATRITPWLEFTQRAIDGVVADTGLDGIIPTEDVAYSIVALYLGLELLTHLDGDRAPAVRLFDHAGRLATLLSALAPRRTKGAAT